MERAELDRVRANEETFARANGEIEDAAERVGVDVVPFICECSATNCVNLIPLPLEAYRHVRATKGFMLCPGHDDPHVEHVVEDHGAYVIVEKFR